MKEKSLRFLETHQSIEPTTYEQYEFALNKIEELLPLVTDETPANAPEAIELALMSDIVESYEKKHYPIGKPTVSELIESSLEEKNMSQKQLAIEIGVSPSRINDYVAGCSGDVYFFKNTNNIKKILKLVEKSGKSFGVFTKKSYLCTH